MRETMLNWAFPREGDSVKEHVPEGIFGILDLSFARA